ncbi:hypothetical protein [Pseudovibrio sp. Tun.PSC04-5.I4]|nr:hypothetical protein [Pseudovibrio sp. Tun.PSC04-5.I4]SDQ29469.1 hypothetical protein SAMN04515695_0749 [Pseudovibrio sp. Tun.PSC04-5.I4]
MPTLTPKGGIPSMNTIKGPKVIVVNGAKLHVNSMISGGSTGGGNYPN